MPAIHAPNYQFGLNELNKNNTYQNSPRIDFLINGQKFGMGFWETEQGTLKAAVFCLTVWSPDGWIVLEKLPPLWYDDLGMDTGTPEDDLATYMWWIGENFNPAIVAYFEDTGMSDELLGVDDVNEDGVISNWEKVLELASRDPHFENGGLQLDGEL